MLSMAIYLRPVDHKKPLLGGTEWNDLARYGFEVGTVIGVLCYVIVQQGEEIKNQGFWSFCKQLVCCLRNSAFWCIFINYNILHMLFGTVVHMMFHVIRHKE